MSNATSLKKQNIHQLLTQATQLHQANQIEQAESIYLEILKRNSKQVDALHLLGVIYFQRKQYQPAIDMMTQACQLAPRAALIHYNLGISLLEGQQFAKAEEHLLNAKKLDSKHYPIFQALAKLELTKNNLIKSQEYLDQLYKLKPNWPGGLAIEAQLQQKKQNFQSAEELYLQVLQHQPNDIQALNNYAYLLINTCNYQPALDCLKKIFQIEPEQPSAQVNLGLYYLRTNQYQKAYDLYNEYLKEHPFDIIAQSNMALSCLRLKEFELALQYFKNILEHPTNDDNIVYFKQKAVIGSALCFKHTYKWEQLKTITETLENVLSNHIANVVLPFEAIMLDASPQQIARINDHFINSLTKSKLPPVKRPARQKRYRIGLVSADLNEHAIGFLLSNMLEYFDRNCFELCALSLSSVEDDISKHIHQNIEKWHDLTMMSDLNAVEYVRQLELDLVIDLGGFTLNARPQLLKQRLAYRQAHWLGYPASLTHQCIDYYICTKNNVVDRQHFSEKLCLLPVWFTHQIPKTTQTVSKSQLGLPEDQFIYCCLQRPYRITADLFQAWLKILQAVPNSILWLFSNTSEADNRLLQQAEAHGVDPVRIIFTPKQMLSKLYPQQYADVWLDTWHVSSGTSSLLAASANCPVLCLEGDSTQSRSSSTIMHGLNMEQLVTNNPQDYINRAIELGRDKGLLGSIKSQLATNLQHSPLTNPQKFMPFLEQALRQMVDQDKPQDIDITIKES